MDEISANLVILLGSGSSIPSGMPSTSEITKHVLSLQDVVLHTDDSYYIVPKKDQDAFFLTEEFLPRVKAVLAFIKKHIESYYKDFPIKTYNYEDFYLVASQIYDAIMFEYRNPAIQPIIDQAHKELTTILQGEEWETRKKWELHELFEETTKCISDIVCAKLRKAPEFKEHLRFLIEACSDSRIGQVDICTLNHDKVLETFFNDSNLPFNDGFVPFSDKSQEFKMWNAEKLFKRDGTPRLLKLHGSIDWYRYRRRDGVLPTDFPAKYIPWNRVQLFKMLNIDPIALQNHPLILVGTFNKILDYQGEMFHDLQHCFYDSLRKCNKLFVCGYSFNDRAVNTRIIIWMYGSAERVLTIAHNNFETLKSNSSPAISRSFVDWIAQNRLVVIPKDIQNLNWNDIQAAIGLSEKKVKVNEPQ